MRLLKWVIRISIRRHSTNLASKIQATITKSNSSFSNSEISIWPWKRKNWRRRWFGNKENSRWKSSSFRWWWWWTQAIKTHKPWCSSIIYYKTRSLKIFHSSQQRLLRINILTKWWIKISLPSSLEQIQCFKSRLSSKACQKLSQTFHANRVINFQLVSSVIEPNSLFLKIQLSYLFKDL